MKKLLQQSLDALESAFKQLSVGAYVHGYTETCDNLRKAIEAPEPEPVGYTDVHGLKYVDAHFVKVAKSFPPGEWLPCYASTPDIEALRQELERVKGERDALAIEVCSLIKDLL